MNILNDSPASAATTVIDVRTTAEFNEGHLNGSVNIPLADLASRIDELKAMPNIVVCCASGVRSKKAATLLSQHGIVGHDGGSWLNLQNQTTT